MKFRLILIVFCLMQACTNQDDFKSTQYSQSISRYGNPATYNVNGENFEVMPSAEGYTERGVASWYGPPFHKQRTSSGEQYDMYELTAAHKTLPLPTYLKVKNLSNDREIIVKVNDRGPFVGKRIIDLSYAAAKKLGVLANGTAMVELSALKSIKKKASYFIQAGAFDSQRVAQSFREKLLKLISKPIKVEHGPPHYLVRVGPFEDKEDALKWQHLLQEQGITGAFTLLA